MELENKFHVPVPIDEAWPVLLDVQRIAPCMPGATLGAIDGDRFEGKVKVKVGPIVVIYNGSAEFLEKDHAAHRVVISASGKETRGTGTAKATVTAQLAATEGGTDVTVSTELAITGKPAQFGRGVISDVSNAIIGQFAKCLVNKMTAEDPGPSGAVVESSGSDPAPAAPVTAAPEASPGERSADDAPEVLDLLGSMKGPALKRLAPVAGGVFALLVGVVLLRRRRH